MAKEYCFKIPSADMPMIQKVLKGKCVRFGKVYEEPPGCRWFLASFDADQDDAFLARMYFWDYEQVTI